MKEKILMIVFVLILGAVWTTALVRVDEWTAPRIEKHRILKLRISVLDALGIPYESREAAEVEEAFVENVEVKQVDGRDIYLSKSGDIAFEVRGSGVQGPISGVVALQADLETIRGITIVANEETPGLGDRVFEKETLDRFKGKKVVPKLLILPPGATSGDNEVDGITGATLTCNAFQKLLNVNIEQLVSLTREDAK